MNPNDPTSPTPPDDTLDEKVRRGPLPFETQETKTETATMAPVMPAMPDTETVKTETNEVKLPAGMPLPEILQPESPTPPPPAPEVKKGDLPSEEEVKKYETKASTDTTLPTPEEMPPKIEAKEHESKVTTETTFATPSPGTEIKETKTTEVKLETPKKKSRRALVGAVLGLVILVVGGLFAVAFQNYLQTGTFDIRQRAATGVTFDGRCFLGATNVTLYKCPPGTTGACNQNPSVGTNCFDSSWCGKQQLDVAGTGYYNAAGCYDSSKYCIENRNQLDSTAAQICGQYNSCVGNPPDCTKLFCNFTDTRSTDNTGSCSTAVVTQAPVAGWGVCGSCPAGQQCGTAPNYDAPRNECVTNPQGGCSWDPGRCGTGGVTSLPLRCDPNVNNINHQCDGKAFGDACGTGVCTQVAGAGWANYRPCDCKPPTNLSCGQACKSDSECRNPGAAGTATVCRNGICEARDCAPGQTTPGANCSCGVRNRQCGQTCGPDVGLCEGTNGTGSMCVFTTGAICGQQGNIGGRSYCVGVNNYTPVNPSYKLGACTGGDTGNSYLIGPGGKTTGWTQAEIDATCPKCGDGIVTTGEQCDQGGINGQPTATCSSTCQTKVAVTPTSTPTLTQTATPTEAIGMCVATKLYAQDPTTQTWAVITPDQVTQRLKVGDQIRISTSGSGRAFTSGRFRIAVSPTGADAPFGNWVTSAVKNEQGEYYINYTIPSSGTFQVQAQVL